MEHHFKDWFRWARRSQLEPIKKVALTIHRHWKNIKTYFDNPITNAASESTHSKIQRVKAMARGFRNRERYRNAIYFHCGGLDLYSANHSSQANCNEFTHTTPGRPTLLE